MDEFLKDLNYFGKLVFLHTARWIQAKIIIAPIAAGIAVWLISKVIEVPQTTANLISSVIAFAVFVFMMALRVVRRIRELEEEKLSITVSSENGVIFETEGFKAIGETYSIKIKNECSVIQKNCKVKVVEVVSDNEPDKPLRLETVIGSFDLHPHEVQTIEIADLFENGEMTFKSDKVSFIPPEAWEVFKQMTITIAAYPQEGKPIEAKMVVEKK